MSCSRKHLEGLFEHRAYNCTSLLHSNARRGVSLCSPLCICEVAGHNLAHKVMASRFVIFHSGIKDKHDWFFFGYPINVVNYIHFCIQVPIHIVIEASVYLSWHLGCGMWKNYTKRGQTFFQVHPRHSGMSMDSWESTYQWLQQYSPPK